jgi:hypothetical protein
MQYDPNHPSGGDPANSNQHQSPYGPPQQPPGAPGYPPGQYGYQANHGYPEYGPPPHSGLGIAATIIGALAILGFCVLIGVLAAQYSDNPAALENMDEESPEAMAIGLAVCASGLFAVIGAVLAFIGMAQTNRNKTFAIIGAVVNGLYLLGVACVILAGLAGG